MNVFFYFYIMIHNAPLFYTRCVAENFTSFAFPVSALHYIRAKEYIYFIREERQKHQKQIDSQRWYAREVCDR